YRFWQCIRPVRSPFGSFIHPPPQHVDLIVTQRCRIVGHPQFWIVFGEPLDKAAVGCIPPPDCRLARFGGRKGLLLEQQTEATIFLYPSMATDALLVEDRLDLRTEINPFFSPYAKQSD